MLGLVLLATGLTLNTKTNLGASAVMSVPYAISEIWGSNIGDVTFLSYILFITAQIIIHIIVCRRNGGKDLKVRLFKDIMQLPVNLVFTRIINIVSALVPVLAEAYPDSFMGSFAGRLLVMAIAMITIGTGSAMILNMRLFPSAADGLVQAIAELTGLKVGLTKNIFDVSNVCVTLSLGLIFTHSIVGVGLGTVCAALFVGRVVATFNRLCSDKLWSLCGLDVDVTAK